MVPASAQLAAQWYRRARELGILMQRRQFNG
jgi:hypothetical protein